MLEDIQLFVGSHNEESNYLAIELINQMGKLAANIPRKECGLCQKDINITA